MSVSLLALAWNAPMQDPYRINATPQRRHPFPDAAGYAIGGVVCVSWAGDLQQPLDFVQHVTPHPNANLQSALTEFAHWIPRLN